MRGGPQHLPRGGGGGAAGLRGGAAWLRGAAPALVPGAASPAPHLRGAGAGIRGVRGIRGIRGVRLRPAWLRGGAARAVRAAPNHARAHPAPAAPAPVLPAAPGRGEAGQDAELSPKEANTRESEEETEDLGGDRVPAPLTQQGQWWR